MIEVGGNSVVRRSDPRPRDPPRRCPRSGHWVEGVIRSRPVRAGCEPGSVLSAVLLISYAFIGYWLLVNGGFGF